MSAALALLGRCTDAGLHLWAEGERLRYRAAEPPEPELLTALREHKRELLAHLAAVANDPKPALDADALATWLQSEGLALVMRNGALVFTGPNGRGTAVPSAVLRQHIEDHRDDINTLFHVSEPSP